MAKDVDLFVAAMADVEPLKGRRRVQRMLPAKPPPEKVADRPVRALPSLQAATALSADDRSFDRDIDRALSRGRRSPDGKLDLHGMTLATAERAVAHFLEEAMAQDWRVVLIVTGKGLREEGGRMFGGRIRAEFTGWLNRADNRARVRSVRVAHPRHGGSGAFYVLLRRRSSASSRSLRATPQR